MTLSELAASYATDHDEFLSDSYRRQLHFAATNFSRFLGAIARPDHLTRDLIHAYLAWMRDEGRSQATLKSRRAALLVLARYASERGLLSGLPRVKRIRLGRIIPEAWSPEEIRRLVCECRGLRGRFHGGEAAGIPRSHYMVGLVVGLYDTGLRLADAQQLERRDIAADGSLVVRQNKTGREIVRYFSAAAVAAIDASGAWDRRLIWPLWGRREAFFALVRRLVRDAEIRRGTLKWLRRAGVTAVVREQGIEAGRLFADHASAQTTRDHYLDSRQLGEAPRPPELW